LNSHCDGSLNVVKYHGQGRESSPIALADTDIVLSTYHTIAAEALDHSSPVYKIEWFRIVLDEGKKISIPSALVLPYSQKTH
jgi:SWI/SNF-related matrix-associated actin-dependent regulator of chromatin subfamily A3